MSDDTLRTRIADTLGATLVHHERSVHLALADAVIRELNTERDELVNDAIRDLQEKYILVPKSQTLAEMAPPRLVIDRDCTPLEWPAEWKEGGQ